MAKTLKENSRTDFTVAASSTDPEVVRVGCLQRIADATELMAKNYVQLQNDRDLYKNWYEQQLKNRNRLEKHISTQKGIITKLKNKLSKTEKLLADGAQSEPH